ncbi:hypothetical protein Mal15_35630 [Stieleria maiorica]|uniref:Uncharacterized protein n=1 Tax=Stieleria maiorica TaxID=2795974 RepID=A0A5B9MEH4_9BACT|nr:hypothetical protein Mal15_35630 [Stieleria maiorica]
MLPGTSDKVGGAGRKLAMTNQALRARSSAQELPPPIRHCPASDPTGGGTSKHDVSPTWTKSARLEPERPAIPSWSLSCTGCFTMHRFTVQRLLFLFSPFERPFRTEPSK